MAWTPDKVEALLSSGDAEAGERTAHLKEVLAGLREETENGLAAVVEKLADGARNGESGWTVRNRSSTLMLLLVCLVSWRLPLGESGLLEFVLSAVPIKKEVQHPLNKQALRLVGNACADCGKNKY
jgi:hypothetical protein